MKGNVKFFNDGKGFGFIAGEDGKEYFVHVSGLAQGTDTRDLQENVAVTFDVTMGDRGPKAENVALDQGGEEAPAEEAPMDEAPEPTEEEAPAEEEPAEEEAA